MEFLQPIWSLVYITNYLLFFFSSFWSDEVIIMHHSPDDFHCELFKSDMRKITGLWVFTIQTSQNFSSTKCSIRQILLTLSDRSIRFEFAWCSRATGIHPHSSLSVPYKVLLNNKNFLNSLKTVEIRIKKSLQVCGINVLQTIFFQMQKSG